MSVRKCHVAEAEGARTPCGSMAQSCVSLDVRWNPGAYDLKPSSRLIRPFEASGRFQPRRGGSGIRKTTGDGASAGAPESTHGTSANEGNRTRPVSASVKPGMKVLSFPRSQSAHLARGN